MQSDQELLLGGETYIRVLEAKYSIETEQSYTANTEFRNYLRKLLNDGVEILGTGEEFLYDLEFGDEEFDELSHPYLHNFGWRSAFNFLIPYLKIEIQCPHSTSK